MNALPKEKMEPWTEQFVAKLFEDACCTDLEDALSVIAEAHNEAIELWRKENAQLWERVELFERQ